MSKSLLPYGILPSQGNLTNPGIEPRSPTLQVDSLLAEPQGKLRILQARILEWVVFPFSRGSSQPRDRTQVSHTAGGFFSKG